jgi:hypothetical protein
VKGFASQPTRGSCRVISFDRAARWRRAGTALAKWWGVAALSLFIPVAHAVLVPGFLGFGLYQFVRRVGARDLACDARGTCPDCGVEQALEVASRWQVPQDTTCAACHRGLTLSLPSEP